MNTYKIGDVLLLIDSKVTQFRRTLAGEICQIVRRDGDTLQIEMLSGSEIGSQKSTTHLFLRGLPTRKVTVFGVSTTAEGVTYILNCGEVRISGITQEFLEVEIPEPSHEKLWASFESGVSLPQNTDHFSSYRYQIGGEISEHLSKMDISVWNGHMQRGVYFYKPGWYESPRVRIQHMTKTLDLRLGKMETGELEYLQAVLKAGKKLAEPYVFKFRFGVERLECPFCNEKLTLATDGISLHVVSRSGNPCPHPEGLITEWTLNVPSGQIVVANDLRHWFRAEDDNYDVNKMIGTHTCTLAYAKAGMSHGFVGNSCPSVYQKAEANDAFLVGIYRENLCDEDYNEYPNPEPCPWNRKVASICTDLWWYSIVDKDEFERRWNHYTPKDDFQEFVGSNYVVDVKPGVYKFVHPQGIDRDVNLVEFANFTWVREPDPLLDFLGEDMSREWTATEVLMQSLLSWPTLYCPERPGSNYEDRLTWSEMDHEQRMNSLARAADQVMCVLGGGTDWHENGFPRGKVSKEAQDMAAEWGEIPLFEGIRHWYPISEGYNICLAAGVIDPNNPYTAGMESPNMAPTFVQLGLNITRNMIKFGESDIQLSRNSWPPRYETAAVRHRMHLAVRIYRGLREKYPDVEPQDAEFDVWMSNTDTEIRVGSIVDLIDTEDYKFAMTTGAKHWDGTGFLPAGHVCRIKPSEPYMGTVIEFLTGPEARDGGYCVESKDYERRWEKFNDLRVTKVQGDMVTVKINRRNLTLPSRCFKRQLTAEEHVDAFDLGPQHPPKSTWGPDPSFVPEGAFLEFTPDGNTDIRKGSVSLSRYQGTTEQWGESWYGDRQSSVPVPFVAHVVRAFMSNQGPLLEIRIGGNDQRLALKREHKRYIRYFDSEDEYNQLQAKISDEQATLDAEKAKFKANPDFTFKEMQLSVAVETPKSLGKDGSLISGDVILNLNFNGSSQNGPNEGYGYYHTESLTSEHPIFGTRINEVVPVGWKMNKRSVVLVVCLGDQHYSKTFRLNAKTAYMGKKSAWKPVTATKGTNLAKKPFADK